MGWGSQISITWVLWVLGRVVSVIVACLRVVGRYFKGYFVGGSMRVIEDILLSERDGGGGSRRHGRIMAVLFMCSEPGTGRVAKWHTRKSRF
jgi:hypothetical protein